MKANRERLGQPFTQRLILHGGNQAPQAGGLGHLVTQEFLDERQILLPPHGQFAQGQVVGCQAPTDGTVGVLVRELDQSVFPALG